MQQVPVPVDVVTPLSGASGWHRRDETPAEICTALTPPGAGTAGEDKKEGWVEPWPCRACRHRHRCNPFLAARMFARDAALRSLYQPGDGQGTHSNRNEHPGAAYDNADGGAYPHATADRDDRTYQHAYSYAHTRSTARRHRLLPYDIWAGQRHALLNTPRFNPVPPPQPR